MSDRAYIATRKGLFEAYRTHEAWLLDRQHFLGDPVSMLLPDRRDGTLYAALHLGHFGAKLHRRDAGSSEWVEVAAAGLSRKAGRQQRSDRMEGKDDLVAGGRRAGPAGRAVGRHVARWPVPLG